MTFSLHGFRGRAQEVAHEFLGDLSRAEAKQRIWRETQADRFTGFDRRLLQASDAKLEVDDGVGGSDAWAALTRGAAFATLKRWAWRRRDIIRTLHQRRLESGRDVRELGEERVRGRLVKIGHHDELGASGWVIVRDTLGKEHFARVRLGQSTPRIGCGVELINGPGGVRISDLGRGQGRDL